MKIISRCHLQIYLVFGLILSITTLSIRKETKKLKTNNRFQIKFISQLNSQKSYKKQDIIQKSVDTTAPGQITTSEISAIQVMGKHPDADKWAKIFNVESTDQNCLHTEFSVLKTELNAVEDTLVPRVKENFYGTKIGRGYSAYLFDYIDDILQKDISADFKAQFDAAKALPLQTNYTDPYPLSKLMPGNIGKTEEELGVILSRIKRGFNYEIYKNSLTAPQVKAVLDTWNYTISIVPRIGDYAKKFLDKFDFDGDGRLNPKEFTYASIVGNRYQFDNLLAPCTNCFNKVIKEKIDPIYTYLDCTDKSAIGAEQMWELFKTLKKPSKVKYNFYLCEVKEGNFRISAYNDLILKVKFKRRDAKLTKTEFREAILLGYANRQTTEKEFFMADEFTGKATRWSEDGLKDLICIRTNEIRDGK